MKTYKKGISLIVLVITVIILAILASTVIISLNNSNIIENASNAVNDSNIANKKYAAQLYLADYFLGINKGTIPESKTAAEYVEEQFAANNMDMSGIYINDEGQIVEGYPLPAGVELAAEVLYEAPEGAGYTGKWKVLGVDNQGRIKLVSEFIDTGVNKYTESEPSTAYGEKPEEAYNNVITAANNKGNSMKNSAYHAVEGRSINIDDINQITGFKPSSYTDSTNGQPSMREYNNKVTYTLTSGGLSAIGTNGVTATTAEATTFKLIGETNNITEPYTATSTYYSYYPADYIERNNNPVWDMLFEIPVVDYIPYMERTFYIADQYVETKGDKIHWGIRLYSDLHNSAGENLDNKSERISGETFWFSSTDGGNTDYCATAGMKAVVIIDANYTLKDTNSDGIWEIVAKQQ